MENREKLIKTIKIAVRSFDQLHKSDAEEIKKLLKEEYGLTLNDFNYAKTYEKLELLEIEDLVYLADKLAKRR